MAQRTKSSLARAHTVHRYLRIEPKDPNKSATYRCTIAGCRSYLREEFMVGQICECNRCGEDFEFTKRLLYPRKIRKPHCNECTKATFNRKTGRVEKKGQGQLSDVEIYSALDDIIKGL